MTDENCFAYRTVGYAVDAFILVVVVVVILMLVARFAYWRLENEYVHKRLI